MTITTKHDEWQVRARAQAFSLYIDMSNQLTGRVLAELVRQNAFQNLDVFIESMGCAVFNREDGSITITGHLDAIKILIIYYEGNPAFTDVSGDIDRAIDKVLENLGYDEETFDHALVEHCLKFVADDISEDIAVELWDYFHDLPFSPNGNGRYVMRLLQDPDLVGVLAKTAREDLGIEPGEYLDDALDANATPMLV